MANHITYSPDTVALLTEVQQSVPHFIIENEDGTKSLGPMVKTPTLCNGGESLAIVGDLPADLQGLTNLIIIGEQYWDGNGDPQITFGYGSVTAQEAQAIYDRVYPRTPSGDYTPPPIFGSVKT